jgi:hypothetical protein
MEQILKYQMPDQTTLDSAQALLTTAETYVINSPAMAECAGEDLKAIKAKYNELDTMRKSITTPLDQAKKGVMDLFRGPLEYLERAESTLKRSLINFQQEEQRKAREAQARAEEAARKEREKLEEKAAKAEASGKTEKAEAFRDVANMTVTPIVTQVPTKIAGLSTRTIWRAHVKDKRALVEAALTRADIMALIMVDETALNKLATALKENLSVPGVEAYSEDSMSARAA